MAFKDWLGAGIGAALGIRYGGGLLGALAGAVLGNWVQGKISAASRNERRQTGDGPPPPEVTVLTALAAMLAKMAKADGRVTADEIRFCEELFERLGLTGEKRRYCVETFRRAKQDAHSIYDYADAFVAAQEDASVRSIVYGILWDMADADGVISEDELRTLERLADHLRVGRDSYVWQCHRHGVGAGRQAGGSAEEPFAEDPYAVLGCARAATDEELRTAYRDRAKRLHPDMLRAQGLSEELVNRANGQMARLNAAWATIRKERGL